MTSPRRGYAGAIALIGMLAMAAATEPALWASHADALRVVLLLCEAFFLARLGWRLWTRRGDARGPAQALGTADGIADAASALAVPLAFALGGREPLVWLAGAVWTLQLAAAPEGLRMLARVVALEARPIAAVGTLFATILLGSAVAAFLLEHRAQPEAFGSLPASLWWAVTTLTTTGYGDAVPHSPIGRLLAAVVMISGLSVFGLFTGILATGFAAESRRRDFLRSWELVSRVPFFRSLESAGLAEIAGALRRMDVAANMVIIRRGRPGDCMYFIVSGEVEVDVSPRPVRLAEGDFFGEMALLGGGTRNATISAVRPTTLLVLDVADFRRMTARHPALAAAVEAEAFRRAGDPINYSAAADRPAPVRHLETEP
jgi:voltage-gated potassium channel